MQAKIWGQASFEAKREARPGQVLEYTTPNNQSYYRYIYQKPTTILQSRIMLKQYPHHQPQFIRY